MGAGQEQGVASVVLAVTMRPYMAKSVRLRPDARDGGACRDCAVEPQRGQVGSDWPAGRRAGASRCAHCEGKSASSLRWFR